MNARHLFGCLALGIALLSGALFSVQTVAEPLTLKSTCPPGFQLVDGNQCLLRNMYQFYDSLQNEGVGGTKTALPAHRDGFSPQQIDLGRYLFFDPILSADHSLSCASCHQPDKGFADGLGRSVGVLGKPVKRSAPSLWNVAFMKRFFWDGRATTLEQQMLGPLYAADEMGNTPEQIVNDLNASAQYRELFSQGFPEFDANITLAQLYTALTAFQTSLISLNSRYDQYAHGYAEALNDNEIAGLNVFRSFVARCAECHTPPLFSNQQIAVIGAPEPDGLPLDVGAEKTFNTPRLKGGFKVPSLRNIASTAPYMHSGKFQTLRDAVAFYNGGRGHAVPENVEMQLHWHIWEPNLQEHELDLLVDFLKTLTDEAFTPAVPATVPSGLTPSIPIDSKHLPTTKISSVRR